MKPETNPTDKIFGISEDEHLNLIIISLFLFYITENTIWEYLSVEKQVREHMMLQIIYVHLKTEILVYKLRYCTIITRPL